MRRTAAVALGLAWLAVASVPGTARAEEVPLWSNAPPRHRGPGGAGFTDLSERARAAVVHVRGEVVEGGAAASDGDGGKTSIGTGFIISSNGYVVTNEHVVRGVGDLRIRLYDGRELPACVAGADPATDIALLKIDPKRSLPSLPLGDSNAVRVGEPVIAIGNPYGFNHSVTAGIVSAKERVVDRAVLHDAHGGEDSYSFFIQTDASINLGNSGGPLIDATGAVVGVSAAFWAGHPLQPAQGIGFAIPINMAKALLPRLARDGVVRRSYLGVDAQPIDPALAEALRLTSTRGALIASVEKGSPAEASGIEPGDVVVSWNAAPVTTSEDFKIDAQLSIPGVRVKVALLRDGKRWEREIVPRATASKVVAPHPSSCALRRTPEMASVEDFDVQELPAGRAAALPGGRGVAVSRVTDHGAADQAGLKVGDVVLRIGNAGVRTPADVGKALASFKVGETLPVLVRRSGFDFWMAFVRR
jgi:serine protease Do